MTDVGRPAALVAALVSARKAVQLYPPAHPHHVQALETLVRQAGEAADAGSGTITLYQGRLYSGSDVLGHELPGVDSLAGAMEARSVQSLTFHAGFGPADATGLLEVLAMRQTSDLDVRAELEARGVTGVHVSFLVDEEAEERERRDRSREEDRALYRQVVACLRAIRDRLSEGQSASLDQAATLAAAVVARIADDKASVIGLATLNSQGEVGLFHAVNVMIYALALGATLGLDDAALGSLGVGALLHDIGKVRFDPQDPKQWETARAEHPAEGAQILSRLEQADRSPMLVAYEHHMAIDGSGWPDPPNTAYVLHPYSRAVAIADAYEHFTKGDGIAPPVTPDRAIAKILAGAGTLFDPIFARLFAKAMGVFPIGCAVRLSDHSTGVVSAENEDLLKPVVRLLFGPDGSMLDPPVRVDLATDERDVVEVIDPAVLKLDVSEHL